MMRSLTRTIFAAIIASVAFTNRGAAQDNASASAPPPLPANDTIFRRARRLVSEGNGATGRALVDSMLQSAAEGTAAYGDALFWRGALSETAADAERDYRRVIVEYPLSPYADDALLSLAELEQARGDRSAAYQHLQRFVREHPASPARARAGLAAARLAFEQRDVGHGCAMIADARASAGTSDVELRNQIEYYGARCPTTAAAITPAPNPQNSSKVAPSGTTRPGQTPPATATASAARPTSTSPSATVSTETPPSTAVPSAGKPTAAKTESRATESARPDGVASGASTTRTSVPRGLWTIQLAAYNTRVDAERLVAKLSARGVKARISGDAKPFRVRLDYYPTRQAAAAVVSELKQRGIIGFVTDEPRATGATRP